MLVASTMFFFKKKKKILSFVTISNAEINKKNYGYKTNYGYLFSLYYGYKDLLIHVALLYSFFISIYLTRNLH